MAKIKFRDMHMSKSNKTGLETINEIIEEYQSEGYTLTLRQLYYQLVSRDVIPNKQSEYSKLSTLLKEGRMAGIVDWEAIEDRLRKPNKPSCWENPKSIIDACISQYRCDRMEGQEVYIEVWVEKDALSGVLKRITEKYGISIIVNRGYSSATAMFDAHERFNSAHEEGKIIKVIYVGDFDPSGQDMIRDITDRTEEFNQGEYDFEILPIALTWNQIQAYSPPPNPAKITDPRAKEYILKHGATSWEVDALRPEILNQLLNDTILENIDEDIFNAILEREKADKKKLRSLTKLL